MCTTYFIISILFTAKVSYYIIYNLYTMQFGCQVGRVTYNGAIIMCSVYRLGIYLHDARMELFYYLRKMTFKENDI